MDWDNCARTVNFGKADKPDKYGFTKKMHKIMDLVEAGKRLEDGGFEINPDDREYYDAYKSEFEYKKKLNGGKPYRFPRYIVE